MFAFTNALRLCRVWLSRIKLAFTVSACFVLQFNWIFLARQHLAAWPAKKKIRTENNLNRNRCMVDWHYFRKHFLGIGSTENGTGIKKYGSLRCHCRRLSFLLSAFVQRKSLGTSTIFCEINEFYSRLRYNLDTIFLIRFFSHFVDHIFHFTVIRQWMRCKSIISCWINIYITKRHYALRFKSNNDNRRTKHRQLNNRPAD